MLGRDKEIAMLEETAKNVPAFNLPANFSFTENVGHSTTSNFFLTDICSQMQPTEHDATAAKEPYTESLPHSTSGVPPAQKTQPTVTSVPNFFASSAAFQKPLDLKIPSLMFGAQGSTTVVSDPAPLHAASSISSSSAPFSYGTPSANFNAKGHVNPPVPSFPTEDAANPLWDGEKKTENPQRDQKLSLGQQVYAPAGSMSYGGRSSLISQYCTYRLTVNNPSSFHAEASGNQAQVGSLTLPDDSDQDCQMDVSPPSNRSTSSGFNVSNPPVVNNPVLLGDAPSAPPTSTVFFALSGNSSSNVLAAPLMTESRSEGSQPFGQSFGQTSQSSFTAPGFASPSLNQHTPVPPPVFAGPSSFPPGVPFEAGANQFNPNQSNPTEFNHNQFNQSHPNSFNQFNPNQFNPNPTSFNQSDQSNPNQFNQSTPNQFSQSTPNQFSQSTPNQFSQSTPNQFSQSTPNQFNPSAPSSSFSTPVPSTSSASLASNPVVFTIGTAPPLQLNRYGRPMKKLPQRNRMRQ